MSYSRVPHTGKPSAKPSYLPSSAPSKPGPLPCAVIRAIRRRRAARTNSLEGCNCNNGVCTTPCYSHDIPEYPNDTKHPCLTRPGVDPEQRRNIEQRKRFMKMPCGARPCGYEKWTDKPTHDPSTFPTATPSVKPTGVPSVKPTAVPTVEPTVEPTGAPSVEPTAKPTGAPSWKPTAKPTGAPSVKPTAKPSAEPSVKPTEKPTAAPTAAPTAEPTVKPTIRPTGKPSEKPTGAPSEPPTIAPTGKPSAAPSTLEPSSVAPTTGAPSTQTPVAARLECTVQGDPHVAPFVGGHFDLHHEGVFQVARNFNFYMEGDMGCRSVLEAMYDMPCNMAVVSFAPYSGWQKNATMGPKKVNFCQGAVLARKRGELKMHVLLEDCGSNSSMLFIGIADGIYDAWVPACRALFRTVESVSNRRVARAQHGAMHTSVHTHVCAQVYAQVLKHGELEVQVLLKDCGSDFQTKDKLSWSGGVPVKCVAAAAIKLSGEDGSFQYLASNGVLEQISGSKTSDELGDKEFEDGWEYSSRKGKADFVKYLDEDYENSIQVTFMQDPHHEAVSVFIVLEEKKGPKTLFGKSPGLCAGGGQAQLTAAYRHVDRHEIKHSGGGSCQHCSDASQFFKKTDYHGADLVKGGVKASSPAACCKKCQENKQCSYACRPVSNLPSDPHPLHS